MASQIVPADKRYRVSLLLDTYGELLTDKQRTFLHHYFEEDLSFGEIAREYGVSRQAIFDSVKHGEEALENFERVLRLVENGWARWISSGQSLESVIERLTAARARIEEYVSADGKAEILRELDSLIAALRGGAEGEQAAGLEAEAETAR